jgi:hypothetical protein
LARVQAWELLAQARGMLTDRRQVEHSGGVRVAAL